MQHVVVSVCFALLLHATLQEEARGDGVSLITYSDCLTPNRVGTCDFLALLGAEVARDTINADPHRSNVTLYPIEIQSSTSTEIFDEALLGTIQVIDQLNGSRLHGYVGPQTFLAVKTLVPLISRFSNLTIVSYSVTSQLADNYLKFYRTLPSDIFINYGRLNLIIQFKWLRIGILYSEEEEHAFASNQFSDIFNKYLRNQYPIENVTVFSETLPFSSEDELRTILNVYRKADMRIFIGFFGPKDARNVLCQARELNLTDVSHTWVLPAYASPNWWRRASHDDQSTTSMSCSDKEIMDALQSVVFVDAVKFPPFDMTMADFVPRLYQKASERVPTLSHEDFLANLLNSRAVSVYDAAMMLAASTGPIGSSTPSPASVRDPLNPYPFNPCLLDCEWCRIYWPDFTNVINCSDCPRENIAADCSLVPVNPGERALATRYYGQILYTQFTGAQHCPVALYWATPSKDFDSKHFRNVSNFTDCSNCTNGQLLEDIALLLANYTNCPKTFTWKGRSDPPISLKIDHSSIHGGFLAVAFLVVIIGLLMTVAFCGFNIIWRKNRIVKATSPRLNVIMLTGYALVMPVVIFNGVVYSADKFVHSANSYTALCQLSLWGHNIGFSLVFSIILVKTWRLYMIFSTNFRVKIGVKLKDHYLMLGVVLLLLPVVVILCVWTGVDRWRLQFMSILLSRNNLISDDALLSFNILNVTTCSSPAPGLELSFTLWLFLYFAIIFVVSLFILGVLNRRVTSQFRDETLHSSRALFLSAFPLMAVFLSDWISIGTLNLYYPVYWSLSLASLFFNLAAEVVVYGPVAYQVYRDWRNQERLRVQEECEVEMRSRLNSATKEAKILKEQLEEKKRKIRELTKLKEMHCESSLL